MSAELTFCLFCKDDPNPPFPILGVLPIIFYDTLTGNPIPAPLGGNPPAPVDPNPQPPAGKYVLNLPLDADVYVCIAVPDKDFCFQFTQAPGFQLSGEFPNPPGPGMVCIPKGFVPRDGEGNPIPTTVNYFYQLRQPVICLREDTLVKSGRGAVPICELRAGDEVYDARGRAERVERNIMSGSSREFVRIKRGAFGVEQPSAELFIKRGHPVLLAGQEVPCEQLIDGQLVDEVVLEKSARIYSLCTQRRTFVDMQGLHVGTWAEEAFDNFVQNDDSGRRLAYETL